jgi:hypothetical protein
MESRETVGGPLADRFEYVRAYAALITVLLCVLCSSVFQGFGFWWKKTLYCLTCLQPAKTPAE